MEAEMHNRLASLSVAIVSAGLLVGRAIVPAAAQQVVLGGGINGGSVPRAMAPLCNGARRLDGGGLSGSVALVAQGLRLAANVDHVARVGGMSVAGCVAGTGVSVDSSFAPADRSAFALSASAWKSIADRFDLGLEAGRVIEHSSWFVGPAVGGQYGRVRAEIIGRLHVTSFDEITRDFDTSPVREISRRDRSERSWGVAARVLLVTDRR
jgi:hypothetical protein